MINKPWFPFLAILVLGAGWGFTIPMAKVSVSTGHQPLGLIFWQLIIVTVLLSAIAFAQGRPIPLTRHALMVYFGISILGTVLPAFVSFTAGAQLPAGIMALIIALVTMFSLPIALGLRLERFSLIRLSGLLLGAAAILLIVLPNNSLPDPAKAIFVIFALFAPLAYGAEANFVAKVGLGTLSPTHALLGASILGLLIVTPIAFMAGHMVDLTIPWKAPEWAILLSGIAHAGSYVGYVWLVSRAGSVFASQVAYLVTGFGVIWAMFLLEETYSGWIWLALCLLLGGLVLVQPKQQTQQAS